jgi:putative hemolysin
VDPSPTGDGSWLAGLFLALALVFSFFFSGIEAALSGMGETRVRKLLDNHQGPRGWLELWLRDPNCARTTLLTGHTLATVATVALTTWLSLHGTRWLGVAPSWVTAVLAFALGATALLVLVLSEVVPRTLGRAHPLRFVPAMYLVWPFHLAARVLTVPLEWTVRHLGRVVGSSPEGGAIQVTEEQIEDMVRIGSEAGSIDESQGDILQNVFDLADLSVRTIMTPRTQIYGLPADATFDQVSAEIQASNFSRYPVYDRTLDRIVGIFYAKDLILHALCRTNAPFVLADRLHDAFFVPETKRALHVMKDFQTQSVHMAIVVDEHGGTSGIVTLEDVLEELVGEIYDEYDQPEEAPAFRQVAPEGWSLDASAEIRDLADELELELPETSAFSTVGGFIVDQLGRVPKEGEQLLWHDLRFEVMEADDTKVVRVEVHRDRTVGRGPIRTAAN